MTQYLLSYFLISGLHVLHQELCKFCSRYGLLGAAFEWHTRRFLSPIFKVVELEDPPGTLTRIGDRQLAKNGQNSVSHYGIRVPKTTQKQLESLCQLEIVQLQQFLLYVVVDAFLVETEP